MSVQVIGWVLKGAKVGDAVAKLVLLALANHANDDGTAAWPSQKTIAAYAEVTVRTVRTKLEYLQAIDLIRPGDEHVVAHLPANRRPQVWDLNITGAWAEILSSQDDLRAEEFSSQETPLGGNLRTSGRKAVSYKPSVEPTTKELSLRSSSTRATRLDPDWMPSQELIEQMRQECPTIDLKAEHLKFVDYWCSKAGKDATKIDWTRTWRNWIRNAKPATNGQHRYALKRQEETDEHFARMMAHAQERDRQLGLDTPKEITQ
jgi:hypothetical protein